MSKPFVVACIPAFEERTIGGVVIRAMKYVDRVVVCDDGSGDLMGEIPWMVEYARRVCLWEWNVDD